LLDGDRGGAGVVRGDADGRWRQERVLLEGQAREFRPRSTMRIEMTMATMGRRMKKSAMG
jgi:hypothetical protein